MRIRYISPISSFNRVLCGIVKDLVSRVGAASAREEARDDQKADLISEKVGSHTGYLIHVWQFTNILFSTLYLAHPTHQLFTEKTVTYHVLSSIYHLFGDTEKNIEFVALGRCCFVAEKRIVTDAAS